MAELRCGVITCVHNKMNYCELEGIEVMGNNAERPEQTSCGSFVPRTGESYSNSLDGATEYSNIVCHACECEYNKAKKCHAGKISVTGTNAKQSEQTECATFNKAK